MVNIWNGTVLERGCFCKTVTKCWFQQTGLDTIDLQRLLRKVLQLYGKNQAQGTQEIDNISAGFAILSR